MSEVLKMVAKYVSWSIVLIAVILFAVIAKYPLRYEEYLAVLRSNDSLDCLFNPAYTRGYQAETVYLKPSVSYELTEDWSEPVLVPERYIVDSSRMAYISGRYANLRIQVKTLNFMKDVLDTEHLQEKYLREHSALWSRGSGASSNKLSLREVYATSLEDVLGETDNDRRKVVFVKYLYKCSIITRHAETGSYQIFENEHIKAFIFGDFISNDVVARDVFGYVELQDSGLWLLVHFSRVEGDQIDSMNAVREFLSGLRAKSASK